MTLEDELGDVMSKAQRGLGLATSHLATQAGLDPTAARELRNGKWNEADLAAIAPPLNLRPEGLIRLARGQWSPPAEAPAELIVIDVPAPMRGYEAMRVNAFLVLPRGRRDAFLFDTGTQAEAIVSELEKHGRALGAIFLTHAHWDHCDCLPQMRERYPEVPVFGPETRSAGPLTPLAQGETRAWDGLSVEARETAGHAPHSLSFVVHGLSIPVAIVGDAVFAGSVGGIPEAAYRGALEAIRSQILSLPDETLIAPGHGGLTTVGYERAHNPFFPDREEISE